MDEMVQYFNEMTEEMNRKERELIDSDRKDEANLMKVRANVYGICKTYYEVVSKAKSGEEFWQEYRDKLNSLGTVWNQTYEKAKAHQDVEKIVVEEAKREVLLQVISKAAGRQAADPKRGKRC